MALDIVFTKSNRPLRYAHILRFLFGPIKAILDFINFFSPITLFQNIQRFRYEFVNVKNYIVSTTILAITFLTIIFFGQDVGLHPYIFLTGPVIINALYGGVGPAIFSIICSVLISNFVVNNFVFSLNIFHFSPLNIAFVLESLLISWISITQKRRQQNYALNLLHEQTARLRAQTTSLNLRRQERQKDDFIAIAAHELKNPLASIKAFTYILKNKVKYKKDPSVQAYHLKMDAQINRLDDLVSDLFDASSMSSGRMDLRRQLVDFDELEVSIIIDLQHTISTHRLIIEGQTKAQIHLDPDRFRQVMINLVSNAVKYSPGQNQVIIQLSANPKEVMVAIKDFGKGINPVDQNKIFERFYRIRNNYTEQTSGLGLGLYIVSEIIKLHQGKIWVKSTLKKGSTFFFTLPKSNN